jgi:hypothetical protein
VIFLEKSLKERDYRSLAEEAERRAGTDCGRQEGGRFGPKNQCQDDGNAGGTAPTRSDSWKSSEGDVELSREQLKQSSPVSGGEKLESLSIGTPATTVPLMSRLGASDLDTVVAIGGGAVRDAVVKVKNMDNEAVAVYMTAPVDPSDPASPKATTSVWITEELDGSGTVVDYSEFNSGGRSISDASKQEAGANSSRRLRVASVLKQRMLESLLAAEGIGAKKAVTMAVGSLDNPELKGYRLWPQFGFDATVPRDLMNKIPDETLLRAAGVQVPASRVPRATLLKGLRSQVKKVTIQQLMMFREGENWWTENGQSMAMTLDLRDKSSPGYKRLQEEQKKLPWLRRRNEGRSWYPIDDFERRSCDGSDKDEGGQFAAGNDCGGSGSGGSSPKPPSRAKREQWRKSEDDIVFLDSASLKEGSPVIGGERLHELSIKQPKKLAATLDEIGIKDLDTAVKIGGGAIRGADVRVEPWSGSVSIAISSPVDPDDEDAGSVITSVELTDYGDGLEVSYGGLNTPKGVSDTSKLDAGARDKTRLRIASLMQERMIESLMSAQKAGVLRASTYAAGDSDDPYYQGYRLWPQFGFDAKLDLSDRHPVPAEIILAAFKKKVPESASEAAKQAKKLTAKGFTLQQLISTREGKKWWDDNGSAIDMKIDLKDRKSLGYKKLARLKKLLPKLKDRNVAEGRSLLGWLIEEVTRRSMSVVGFLGGLGQAIEQRDCGPSDKESDGTFAPNNDCQKGAGEGEKPDSGGQKPKSVIWTPGQSAGLVTSKARESLTAVRSDDGKRIVSTPIPGAHVYKGRGARQFVGTVDVGGALASEQDAIRGEKINTGKKVLGGPESEYILASLEEQVRGAMERGISPKFYSPEEREDQLAAFAEMIPEVRGGRTKAGAMIEQEDAENLFRVLQAITSPNASPFINMQRTDSLLQKFFNGDGTVTTSDSLGVTGAGIKKSLRRFQKIVDTLGKRTDGSIDTAAGLRAARELLQGRSLRTGDIKKFFADFASPGEKKGAWAPSSYLVDEVVPVFSTFGPKVGPFYANNNGDLDPLTADVWFSRTWGRVTGELVVPGSPTKSAEQATKLAKVIGKASDDQLHGISGDALAESIKQTGETGAVGDLLRAWAGARLRHYARGDYKEKTGTGGKLNQIAKNIVENDTALIGDPGSGSRRSHMIRLMREVSRKTGTPVAYLQDILWQDEQDAYGALGAMTATNVGEPSLYSDQIRKLAANNGKSRKPRAKPDRGYRRDYEQPDPFFDDYERGGREQMLWESALAHLSDEDFANAVIKLAEKARPTEEFHEERRNFAALDAVIEIRSADCGRQEGGRFGPKNQCQEEGSGAGAIKREAFESSFVNTKRYIPGEEELKQRESFAGTAKDYASKAGLLSVSPEEAIQNATQSQLITSREVRSAIVRYQTNWQPGTIPKILEERVSRATLPSDTPPLYRGMRLTPEVLDGIISQGSVAHGSIHSWSFSPATAASFASMRNPFSKDFARVVLVNQAPRRGLVHPDDDELFEVIVPPGEEKIAKVVRVSGPEGELVFLHLRRRREPLNRSDSGTQTLVLLNSPESRFVAVPLAEDSESRSADCGRQEGGKFGDGNTCAGEKSSGISNSKGESLRGVRGKYDKKQTKVARKLYQMRVPEKNLKGLVRDLGGKVSNTFVEIDSTRGEEGVNVFVRDRDNNETHYIHVGYYGATVYTTDTVSSQEVSKIHAAVKAAMPKAIDDRLWGRGSDYPVYVVNDPQQAEKAWGGLSAKQRLKNERRSADCGRQEGGRFGPKNQCQDDGAGGGTSTASKPSSPLDTNENKTWTPSDGDEPFEGASRFSEVRASGGKKVAESLEKTGISPGEALNATGAPDGVDIWMRPAPEFAAQFDSPPAMFNFEADVAGVNRGLSGSSVIGSVNGEKVVYHSVFDVSPSVQSDPAKRHVAARAFYRTMVASIESARKSGIAEIKFNAAGVSSEKTPGAFRGYTIWPRMGFDAPLPSRLREKLPESLSHAKSLLDLHATREGTKWWAENGEDIDVSFRVGDRSSPQSKIMDRFIQRFTKERRALPLGSGDDWLSPEDLLRLDEMWQEVWDEGDLDDYEYNDGNS